MKKKVLALVLVLGLLMTPLTAKALFGVGDVVFDPTNWAQMLEDYLIQAEQLAQETLAVEQLILQYEIMLLNIKNLNFSGLPLVGGLIASAMQIFENVQGILYNAAGIQAAFTELWSPFRGEPLGGWEFQMKQFDWNEQVRRAQMDVMYLQNHIPVSIDTAGWVVQEALARSAIAVGSLQAEQAGNELLGTLNHQLFEMNQQLAMQGRAQDSQAMMDAAINDQALLNSERWLFEFTKTTPTSGYEVLPRLR